MRANIGSCRAAWMLLATACALTPQSPPETNVMASVALAGIVRNRYVGDCLPMRNVYSVPGFSPVNSARNTLKSVSGYGRGDRLLGPPGEGRGEQAHRGRGVVDRGVGRLAADADPLDVHRGRRVALPGEEQGVRLERGVLPRHLRGVSPNSGWDARPATEAPRNRRRDGENMGV